MEKITPVELYVFRKSDQQAIQLCLYKGVLPINTIGPKRFRWLIKGTYNPFPIRNGTWFEGFDSSIMISRIMTNGYELTERINLINTFILL